MTAYEDESAAIAFRRGDAIGKRRDWDESAAVAFRRGDAIGQRRDWGRKPTPGTRF